MKYAILCVDDEVDNVDALERLFRKKYRVLKATSGDEGLAILKNEDVAVIVSDQRMPNMSGVEFLQQSIHTHPHAIRILLTGYTDINSIIDAINSGEIYRYLTKPWDPVDLQNTVDKAVEKYQLREELTEKNEQLAKALEELRGLDQAKNQFMYLINHELKTPLTSMVSFLDLLKETQLDGDQELYVNRIEKSCERLNRIVHDVLELVSAESGLMPVHLESTTPKTLMSALLKSAEDSARAKKQSFELDLEDIEIHLDIQIIQKVLQRIIDNAIKFGNENSNILVQAKLNDAGNAEFSITNSGKALRAEAIEKILKPFNLDEDIMNHSQGLGLGLSLCQALLRRHSSALHIESPKGQVKVSFELPPR